MVKLSILILILTSISCKTMDCQGVHSGVFITQNKNSGNTKIIRTETTQEEITDSLGIHIKYAIQWVNNCNYLLYNGKLIKGDPAFEGKNTDTLFVEITNVYSNGYAFKASSNFSEFNSSGKAIKIKR